MTAAPTTHAGPTAYLGGTVLAGATDDGGHWMQEWGFLKPDGTPCHENTCACCPHDTGRCRPELASRDRARKKAVDMDEWWRNRAGIGGTP